MIHTSDNLNRFGQTFDRYFQAGKKSWKECVAKQSKEFAGYLYAAAKDAAPQKGELRAKLLAMMKGGKGLLIKKYYMPGLKGGSGTSQESLTQSRLYGTLKNTKRNRERTASVRAQYARSMIAMARPGVSDGGSRRLAFQSLLAENEIAIRESHRMFFASGVKFHSKAWDAAESAAKGGAVLGKYAAKTEKDGTNGTFSWGTQLNKASGQIAFILASVKGHRIIDDALGRSVKNMEVYIARKHEEAARNASRNMGRVLA